MGGWGLWNPNHFLGCTSCAWRVNLSRRVAREPSCILVMSQLSLREAQHTSLLVRSLTELMLSHIVLLEDSAVRRPETSLEVPETIVCVCMCVHVCVWGGCS